ncbi:sigma-54-dependent Fis family transcriptional regulator [Candidatus Nitronereus thalassa]|uniref:DNA-binding transcriptional regulator NtrC n=1 Tax=Candidatus Nitronereus thalassa TaxID=3020898 RepID=A0ABU3K991_9BACT|nr:sigma-54-dependent Fis family transcriptional regulator [Candidatus Nitronereus thalassa]MDT7042971.1 sigma-54-dependent Fis family transcriptional regulator [Candidatus Nitronereus thalassa]
MTISPKASILVVDDNPDNRDLLVRHIERQGHSARTAENGEKALQLLNTQPFDLMLLDIMMPGLSGFEVLEQIKSNPQHQTLPVVVVSALNELDNVEKCLMLGADDYLVKPINAKILKARISNCLDKKRHHDLEQAHHEELARSKTQLEDLYAQLEQSRNNLASILNQLEIGTILIDNHGHIEFISEIAAQILHQPAEDVCGQAWEKVFGLPKTEEAALQSMLHQPVSERSKIHTHLDSRVGKRFWLEIDIKDDPQDSTRKVFVLYDITEIHELRREVNKQAQFQDLVGKSPAMQVVYQAIKDVAPLEVPVLITGDTGSGKELVARAIHTISPRHDEPFVAINCAGLTETLLGSQLFGHKKGAFTGATEDHQGLFEAAHQGTLFLDEIGDMPLTTQATLLRALQEKEILRLGESSPRKVDVRILAATHANLEDLANVGKFRSDLLYRIRVGRIQLPRLQERREDIPLLVSVFLGQARATSGKSEGMDLSRDAMQLLMRYPWPGNVRELKSAIDFALIGCHGKSIEPSDLPPEIAEVDPQVFLSKEHEPDEKERITAILKYTNNNRTEAAKILGMSRSTFYRRLVTLGLAAEE